MPLLRTNALIAGFRLRKAICCEAGASDLMVGLNLTHRPTFRKNYLEPAFAAGLIERTQPVSPRSPTQRYRLTKKGRAFLAGRRQKRGEADFGRCVSGIKKLT